MSELIESKCLESINSLYVELKTDGYSTNPCCLYKDPTPPTVDSIEKLLSNPTIDDIRWKFNHGWKRPECIDCVRDEEMGKVSKRIYSKKRGYDGVIRNWDIRPGNTCNLKCAMCNFSNSSKWIEDIELLTKYKGVDWNHNRENLDFDWIYTKCVDTAEFIYIAGGEPFYMKNVHKFLDKLSKNQWNCERTKILIQTNGVSNTPKFLDILTRFKELEFSISIDGWGKVNELIRFPTDHDTFIKNTDELMQLNPLDIYFNITVQCMNLPNIDELVSNIKNRWNVRYDIYKLHWPTYLRVDSLKPHIVERVLETTQVFELKNFYSDYKYNDNLNKTMQNFLLDLDAKRKTNSKETLGWCFE